MDVVLNQTVTNLINNTSKITTGKNLFNKCTVTSDKAVDQTTGALVSNSLFTASDFIRVKPNTQYTKSYAYASAYYDINKTFISGVSGGVAPETLTTPANCAYMRVSVQKIHLNVYQMEEGSVSTLYEPYRILLNNGTSGGFIDITNFMLPKPSGYYGQVLSTLGDSITYAFNWQPLIQKSLHFSAVNNYGVNGTKIADTGGDTTAMCRDERINAMDANSDVVIVMGGMNDWAQSVPIGTITDTVTSTFYGGVKTMLQKLIARFPSKQIILMSTTFGIYPNRAGWSDTTGILNSLGKSTQDYSAITKEVATLYGITVIDGYPLWNKDNVSVFLNNEGYFFHPNTYGANVLANTVIKGLKTVEPQR